MARDETHPSPAFRLEKVGPTLKNQVKDDCAKGRPSDCVAISGTLIAGRTIYDGAFCSPPPHGPPINGSIANGTQPYFPTTNRAFLDRTSASDEFCVAKPCFYPDDLLDLSTVIDTNAIDNIVADFENTFDASATFTNTPCVAPKAPAGPRKRQLTATADAAAPKKRVTTTPTRGRAGSPPVVAPVPIPRDLFATPRYIWSMAKKRRFDAMQRLAAKRRSKQWGPKIRYQVRQKMAKDRNRATGGTFKKKYTNTWVSADSF